MGHSKLVVSSYLCLCVFRPECCLGHNLILSSLFILRPNASIECHNMHVNFKKGIFSLFCLFVFFTHWRNGAITFSVWKVAIPGTNVTYFLSLAWVMRRDGQLKVMTGSLMQVC